MTEQKTLTMDVLADIYLKDQLVINGNVNPLELANGHLLKIGYDRRYNWEFVNSRFAVASKATPVAKALFRSGIEYPVTLFAAELNGTKHAVIEASLKKVWEAFALTNPREQLQLVEALLLWVQG